MTDKVRRQAGWRLHSWGADPVWEEFDYPGPGHAEVLVELAACGVGLTVLNWAAGDLSNDPALLPRVPGHEIIGTVVEAGDPSSEYLVGRQVTAFSYLFCGRCQFCVAGQENRCLNLAGWVGLHRDGGYAPYAVLPARNAIPVGDELDPVAATVIPDAVSTSVHVCLNRLALTPADRIVVIGAAGGIGIHLVQVAALTGADAVGVDIGETKLGKLEELGVRPVDGSTLADIRGSSLWATGGPTAVIDLVGRPELLQWAVDELGMGGRLIVVTTFRGRSVQVDPRALVTGELSILASRAATRAEYSFAAQLVGAGDVVPVVSEVREPRDVAEIHAMLRAGTLLGRGAVTWSGHG